MTLRLVDLLIEELQALVAPLEAAASSPDALRRLLAAMGWDLYGLESQDRTSLVSALLDVSTQVEQLIAEADSYDDDLAGLAQLLVDVGALLESLANVQEALTSTSIAGDVDLAIFGRELLESLLIRSLLERHPPLYEALVLVGLIDPASRAEESDMIQTADNAVLRTGDAVPRLRLDRLSGLLSDPAATLRDVYLPSGSLATDDDAKGASDRLFPLLGRLAHALGAGWQYGEIPGVTFDLDDKTKSLHERLFAFQYTVGDGSSTVGAMAWLSPASEEDLGFVLAPFGTAEFVASIGQWLLSVKLDASLEAISFRADGLTLPDGAGASDVSGAIQLIAAPDDGQATFVLGSSNGTRLEIGGFSVEAGFERSSDGNSDYGLFVHLGRCALVVGGGEGDSFLRNLLPASESRADFDVHLGWTRAQGLHFDAGSGLSVFVPLDVSILGVLRIDSLSLTLKDESGSIGLLATVDVSAELGPLGVTVAGVGLKGLFTPVDQGGNLGVAEFGLEFKAPDGLGLALDAGVVSGGGYLSFDAVEKRYAGVVELSFGNLSLGAFGLITTELPDGNDGWSFLVIISASMGVPLPFGFFLEAVGGIFGYNRSVNTDVLRAGIKDGTLDSILFPDDPVADAPQILSDLEAVFPATEDQYVFGPMLRIGWPNPSFIDVDLGIVIEAPDPFRVIVLGQLAVALPDGDDPLLQINIDVLGVLDLDEGTLAIDASIYDSYVAFVSIYGDMALRLGWLGQPVFALSVGGWHPDYNPPQGLSTLARAGCALDSDNPQIIFEAYYAVTSNTVQFGAELSLYASGFGVTIEGHVGFNVLLVFSPFSFVTDLSISLTVKAASVTLFGVDLDLRLAGPKPWEVAGTATFEILLVKTKFPIDLTLPPKGSPPSPDAVDVQAKLEEAVGSSGNWSGRTPAGTDPGVTFVERYEDETSLVHPAGGVQFQQSVVPLNVEIDVYSGNPIDGPTRFDLSVASIGGEDFSGDDVSVVEEWFAPGQYFELSETEKLTSPDYETMDAGIEFGFDLMEAGAGVETSFDYETILYVEDEPTVQPPHVLSSDELLHFASSSAVANARKTGLGSRRFQGESTTLRVKDTGWVAAGLDNLVATDQSATFWAASRSQNGNNGTLMQVVPAYEAVFEPEVTQNEG